MRGEVGVEVEEEETQKKSEQKPKRKKRMIIFLLGLLDTLFFSRKNAVNIIG